MDDPPRWARRLVGDVDRAGWWTLPAFLAVGLAGAVMAGSLAVVYYSQQVGDLEAETREARQDLQAGVSDVEAAREEALAAIDEQIAAVENALDQGLPVDDVGALGLVVVEARLNSQPPGASGAAAPPAGDASLAAAPLPLAQQQPPSQQPSDAPAQQPSPSRSPSPSPSPTPSPEPPPERPRLGVGFAVAVEEGQTFIATSYGLVADPRARAGVVERVVVTTMDGASTEGIVHSWDEDRGLALLRVAAGELPVADWRPRTDIVPTGESLTVVGLTPDGEPLGVRGIVALADVEKIVTTLPPVGFLRGAPVLDRTGRVVAVYTPEYRPFGAAAGDGQAAAPVGLFCERMLSGCDQLEAEAPDEPEPSES